AGVVAYYHFDEGPLGSATSSSTGQILDSSGNGLHGTAFNGPVYAPGAPGLSSPTSLSFDGNHQGLFVPDYNALHLEHSMTLEASVYAQSLLAGNTAGNILFRGDNIAGFDPWRLT